MLVKQEFMTSREVCDYCGFSLNLVYKLEKSGHLKPKRRIPPSGRRLYAKEDVDAFLDSIKTK